MNDSLVVFGASLGGLQALSTVLAALPAEFPLPLALVQHRTPDAGDVLCFVLANRCALPLREAEDKLPIAPGTVIVAPAGYHLLVEGGHWALSTETSVQYSRPSIDILFETAAEAFGARTIGVLLSGTGRDGAAGVAAILGRGGTALIESPAMAFAAAMPQAALDVSPGATTIALAEIGPRLLALSQR